MLKGLLPTLKAEKNQNQQEKKLPSQSQPSQSPDQGQNEAFLIAGLNLLSNRRQVTTPLKRDESTTSSLRKLVIIVSILFGVLILVNYLLFILIGNQKIQQDALIAEISSKASIQTQATSISWKIFYYKEILKSRKLLSPRAAFVMEKLSDGFKLSVLKIDYPSFEITARANSLYDFTKLISDYLDGTYVSEITIKSAYLDPISKSFEVTLGGKFK